MPDTSSAEPIVNAAPQTAALSVRRVSRRFGETRVLSNVSLDIMEGSFVAIVGRSGSGKSTLLRLIADLDEPDDGSVEFRHGASRRLMFQEPRLLPWKTVEENVAIGLGSESDPAIVRQAVAQALSDVGLPDRAKDWPSVLSGGQKQRVSLARALVSRPKLLALDEPLGALDALTRIDMQAFIEKVWSNLGFTAVLVTHDVSEAVTLSDRIILLDDGDVALDIAVDLPRPRRRGDPRFAALEDEVLTRLMRRAM